MSGDHRAVMPDAGDTVTLYGVRFTFKVRAGDTDGRLAMVETHIPAGTLVKPHRHLNEDEASIILSGTVHARLGDQLTVAPAGSYLWKPRGVPHAIWNVGPDPVVMAEILTPGGFERYFEEIEPILTDHPGDNEAFYGLAERYGVQVEDDWVEPIEQEFGVTLDPTRES